MKTFYQYDTRWGNLGYKNRPSTMSNSGCGPTACASIIQTKHKKVTPKHTRKFMIKHDYVVNGAGTKWAGIKACLEHWGFKVTVHNDMDSFFKEMSKKGRKAVLLFDGGSRGGITWTLGGHFISVGDYKKENGKHKLYTHDSGGRGHTGWYCYETQMRGLILQAWTCYYPNSEKVDPAPKKKKIKKSRIKLPKRGYYKYGDSGAGVKYLQHWLNNHGYGAGTEDGQFGARTRGAVRRFQKKHGLVTDGRFGKASLDAADHEKGI